jgi:hypothetical protein
MVSALTRSGNILRFHFQYRGDICSKEPSQCLPRRGRLVSLLVLSHCGVSPMPILPQESPYIFGANVAFLSTIKLYSHVLTFTTGTNLFDNLFNQQSFENSHFISSNQFPLLRRRIVIVFRCIVLG